MSGSRFELRKLRNKVYVRIFSGQSVQKHLKKYQSLTQAFIKKFETKLSLEEIGALKKRLSSTENAAGASDNFRDDDLDKEIIRRLMRVQFGSSFMVSSETKSVTRYINCQHKYSMLASTCKVVDKSMTTTTSACKNTHLAIIRDPCSESQDTTIPASSEVISECNDMTMDSISEAMSIIMTLATSSENHDIVNSFMRETKAIMRASSSEPNNMFIISNIESQKISSESLTIAKATSSEPVDLASGEDEEITRSVPIRKTLGKLWKRLTKRLGD